MSGHSKWSKIKRSKGALDAKRGQIFTKIIREITIAAREGGGNPDGNPRLRLAIQNAREANMPAKNIENAVAKGTGQLEGVVYEEVTYEGYGPAGVAILVDAATDNRNRTVGELRSLFTKMGGNLGESGSVGWIFKTQGLITVDRGAVDEDKLMEIALEAGADDMRAGEGAFEIVTSFESFESVKQALQQKKIPMASSEITKLPQNTVKVEGTTAAKLLRLVEALEELDDVQKVHGNFDIDEKEMEKLAQSSS